MNPLGWDREDWRAFAISLWANVALAVVLAVMLRRRK